MESCDLMIAAFDVHYGKDRTASAAAVIFKDYSDAAPVDTVTRMVHGTADYIPGSFYKRELPCLLELIKCIKFPLTEAIVDGYVMLDSRPGLGQHLYMELGGRTPIIGVAKNRYPGTEAVEVLRGDSRMPLFVTSAGITAVEAAERIKRMQGRYRFPTLLKLADRLAREFLPTSRA